jgi:hypothetical protein
MDLLTVLTHELGHVLGLSDLDGQQTPDRIMAGTLQPGQRRSVSVADLLTGDQPMPNDVAPAVGGWATVDNLVAESDSTAAEETTAATRIASSGELTSTGRRVSTTRGQQIVGTQPRIMATGQGRTEAVPSKTRQELDLLDDLFTDAISTLGGLD